MARIDQELAPFPIPNTKRTTPAKKRANYLCSPRANPKIKMAKQTHITYSTPITNPGKETRPTGTSAAFQAQISLSKSRIPTGCGRATRTRSDLAEPRRDGQEQEDWRKKKQADVRERNGEEEEEETK
jgi:hypothetical protein